MTVALAVSLALAGCQPSSSNGLFPYLRPGPGRDRGTSFAAVDRALVQTIAASQRPRAEVAGPPIALTTSDGAGLALAGLEVDAVVTGPLALTQLHLRFHNPEPRRREGRFSITLPSDAAISRFAMRNQTWREAEVVTRQRARQVYETYLRQRVDPALLEKGAGNQFSARVFPIEASADKELILTYSQEVSAASPYRVPLAGLPAVGALRWSITVDGKTRRGEARGEAPRDLRIEDDAVAADVAVAAGADFVVRVEPPVAAGRDPLGPAIVLVDTSGSTASILRRQAAAARAVVTAIAVRDAAALVEVRAFDQNVEPLARGAAGVLDVEALDQAIVARGGLGASDLGRALASLDGAGGRRVIVISDGIATVGERDHAALAARVRRAAVGRLDTITVGGAQDRELLRALAAAGVRGGAVLDGEGDGLAALEQTMLGDVAVAVPGATSVWPTSLAGLAAGQPVVVYGRRAAAATDPLAIEFTARASGASLGVVTVVPGPGPAPLIARAVGRAEVARMTAELATATTAARRAELRGAVEQLGLAHRLVTSETSLLVLETDEDYARFCIARRGLSGLLAIDGGAVTVLDRGAATQPTACDQPEVAAAQPRPALAGEAPRVTATTGAIEGMISERGTREPLIGATVVATVGAVTQTGITDERGWYGLEGLPAGRGQLTIYYADTTAARPIAVVANQLLDTGGGAAARGRATPTPPAPSTTTPDLDVDAHPAVVDQDRTRTGLTIEREYTVNIPVGRTFGAVLGTAAGAQLDSTGVSFSGASSLENQFVGDGIAVDVGNSQGEVITINGSAPTIDVGSTRLGVTVVSAARGNHIDLHSTSLGMIDDHFAAEEPAAPPPPPPPPYEGRLLTVMQHLRAGARGPAVREALAWYLAEPTELAAIIGLGEALEAKGALGLAARAYGTVLDRFPDRVELVRYAGQRLDRLGPAGRALAIDAYRQAVADRPDHVTGHRQLAIALARSGDLDGALTGLERGLDQAASDGVRALLQGDLGLIGAALATREPARKAELIARLARLGVTLPTGPSLRFVLHWETDTNDVDLHVRDRAGDHAYYEHRRLASGGELLEDVTTGYGPEAFVISGAPAGGPYRLSALYFARGVMGLGLGTVQVISYDGAGHLTIEDRPFILQTDGAEVDLGSFAP